MAKYGFYFNMCECIGCRTCQVACKDKNDLDVGTLFRKVLSFETGKFPAARLYHYSGSCNHCEFAKCAEGCPTGAMHYADDGTVQHKSSLCIGCRYCTWNCPYGAPQYRPEIKKVGKCDACKNLTDNKGVPICVDACAMRCLKWGTMEDLRAAYGAEAVQDLPILPDSSITKPGLLVKPKIYAYNKDYTVKEI